MSYSKLADFIQHKMRMSHIYQPVVLITLLENGGECHEEDIAKALLNYDQSQIEYYVRVTNNMVGRVLRGHQLIFKEKKIYKLTDYQELLGDEIEKLVEFCQAKLAEYVEKRGLAIWQHRKKSYASVKGSLKYEVLKRAKFRCELCGISAEEKALEVDHIVPRKYGGTDDISNLQALCYSCNAMKGARDDTDFRTIRESYDIRDEGCVFCGIEKGRVVDENELSYVIYDRFPVTEFHMLIIPKRHTPTYFDLGQAEVNACHQLMNRVRTLITSDDPTIMGFNVGINDGELAGQTVPHCHIHLIPRREGDVDNPRGGIRHVIPNQGNYLSD